MIRFASVVLAGALITITGCSGGGTSTSSPDAAPSPEAACVAVSNARCSLRDRCTAGIYDIRNYGDAAACQVQELANCETSLAAPGQGQTTTTITACAGALTAEQCTPDYSMGVTEPACVPPAGARAIGQGCTFAGQCESTYCLLPTGAACGTCQLSPVVNDDCTLTGECGRDISCLKTVLPYKCVLLVAAGGACDANSPCGGGLACVTPKGATEGTCQAEGTAPGTACDSTNVTAPTCSSASGYFCSGGVCEQSTQAGPGAACGTIPDAGAAFCIGGGLCVSSGKSVPKACVAPAAVGGACDETNGPTCLSPARCVLTAPLGTAGTCSNLDPSACN